MDRYLSTAGAMTLGFNYTGPVMTGVQPMGAVVADFNGDSYPDYALTTAAGTVQVFYGLGAGGGFGPPQTFQAGKSPTTVRVADLNHDGAPELIVYNRDDVTPANNSVTILLNKGSNSGFSLGGTFLIGKRVYDMGMADMNGDQVPDLVLATEAGVQVMLAKAGQAMGGGAPAFQLSALYEMQNPAPLSLAFGDFDKDGFVDVVAGTANGFAVLSGQGDGSFAGLATYYEFGNGNVNSIVAGDLNGDGKLDVVLSTSENAVHSYYGYGDGTFAVGMGMTWDQQVNGVALADVDGDGRSDIVLSSSETSVGVLLNRSGGASPSFQTGRIPVSIPYRGSLVADFYNDKKPGILFAGGTTGVSTIGFLRNLSK